MKKSGSPHKSSSISSRPTDNSVRSDCILALGLKIVKELGSECSVDTLGRWMAHHIADLIARAENATGKEKELAKKNCFEAILLLWKHRAEFPNGKRPFEDLEPVVRAIESLDPDNVAHRYFRTARVRRGEVKDQSEADAWLDMADGLDYSAKVLIGLCLSEAARVAVDKSNEWVKLAEAVEAEGCAPEIVIRFLSTKVDIGNNADSNAEAKRRLKDRIGRLEAFIELAESVVNNMKVQSEALPPLEDGDDIAVEELLESDPIDGLTHDE